MESPDELLADIFDGKKPAFYVEFAGWVRESRRFRAFASTYRVKIRAKLKRVAGEESAQDLRAELETAALLLRDERFTLEYEKYAAAKHRSPDFTILYKTHTPFNVEVRRIRSAELNDADHEARLVKLMAVLIDKVGQMQPATINVLWLSPEHTISTEDLSAVTAALRQLAEHKVEEAFTRRGFASASDFLKHYGWLSGIVLHRSRQSAAGAPDESVSNGNDVWLNPLARHKIPREIATALERLPRN